jgi:hypothetical protein
MLMKIARIENMKKFQGVLRLNKNLFSLQGFKVRTLIMIANNWIILKLKKNCFLKSLAMDQTQSKANLYFKMKTLFTSYETFSIPQQSKRLKMNFIIEKNRKGKILQSKISNR